MRLLVGFVVMLMTITNAHANNPSCQAGTGLAGGALVGNVGALCYDCESQRPLTGTAIDNEYNLHPEWTYNGTSCSSSTTQYWQLTGHIAGYSGDGIASHSAGSHTDLTNGGTWSCLGNTPDPYPAITSNLTTWSGYDMTHFPPSELGYYTSPTPHITTCSKSSGVGPCSTWAQWAVENSQGTGNGHYSTLADADEDVERNDIDYATCNGQGASDGCLGEDVSRNNIVGVDDTNVHTSLGYMSCEWGSSSTTGKNWDGTTVTGGVSDFLPIEFQIGSTNTIDSPGQIYCRSLYSNAGLSTYGSKTTMGFSTPTSSGTQPVVLDVSFQTWPSGGNWENQQFLADTYITFSGTGWGSTPCVIEYDTRLNPCPSTVCPCTSTSCS